jgi:hypothetical protein
VKYVEQDQRHHGVLSLSFGQDGLDAFVRVAGADLSVEYGRVEGPREFAEPPHTGVSQEVEATPAIAGDHPAALDVELRPLAVELRLGNIA